MRNILSTTLLFLCLFLTSGCLPLVFTGAAGSALEFSKDRSAGETISDVKISTSIKASLIKKHFRSLYSRIKVEVMQGRVLLTGNVNNKQDAINAVNIVWQQKGVKEVIDEISVDKNNSKFDLFQYTRDSMITSQIKSKTLINKDIKFSNYTIITNKDVVYLFGLARSEGELKKVAEIAANTNGVKRVVSHVKIHNKSDNSQKLETQNENFNMNDSDNNEEDLIQSNYDSDDIQ